MSGLRALQRGFQNYLLAFDGRVGARITGADGDEAEERLEIYARAYRLRLVEVLGKNYPMLARWMGEDDFERLAVAYLDAHPPQHFSIRYFGGELAAFIARGAFARRAALAEMAAFEWALDAAFDAADAALVSVDDVAALPLEDWPCMTLRFHPALQRLALTHNVVDIWSALNAGREAPGLSAAATPRPWLIWRRDLQTYFRALEPHEACAIDAMRQGRTFAASCEGLCEWMDAAAAAPTAAALLKRWVIDGLVVRLETVAAGRP